METESIPLPSTTTQGADVNLAWKKIVLDLCTEHLRGRSASSTPSKTPRRGLQLPTSESVHLFDTDQLWQSLEFQNKSMLPTTKRRLKRLQPASREAAKEHGNDIANVGLGQHRSEVSSPTERETDTAHGSGHPTSNHETPYSKTGSSTLERLENASSEDEELADSVEVSKRKRLIKAMEEKNISAKPWSLRGEVSASARPKNSLLESTFEYDTAGKANVLAIGDLNDAIEETIRRRIADSQFDDVIPQTAPLPEKIETGPEMDSLSEKPRKGLGELYEEEYTETDRSKQGVNIQGGNGSRRDKEVAEIYAAFERVSRKLDALSSVSVTPLISDIAKTVAEAVPEDLAEGSMVIVQGDGERNMGNGKTKSRGNGSRDQHRKKRRRGAAGLEANL